MPPAERRESGIDDRSGSSGVKVMEAERTMLGERVRMWSTCSS